MINIEKLDNDRYNSIQYLGKCWERFFQRFKEIETTKVELWEPLHLLAYIDKRYREIYNKNFPYSFKKTPSVCPEIILIKRLSPMLSTTDMVLIKRYIDWVIDNKIITNKMKIRTLAIFNTANIANEFLDSIEKKSDTIQRSTRLPQAYIDICNKNNIFANTFGDLAFIFLAMQKTSDLSKKEKYNKLFSSLSNIDFNPQILQQIL